MPETTNTKAQACSFCGASSDAVDRLFVGPGVGICDRCAKAVGAAGAEELPPSKGPVKQLLGRWIKRTAGATPVAVSLRFTEDGLLFSNVDDGSTSQETLLRYSFDGATLSTVEMVPAGERTSGTIEIVAGESLTLHTRNGISVFDRYKSDP